MLEELQLVTNTCEEWGIINNSHTPETILSLRAVWDVLGKVRVFCTAALLRFKEQSGVR